MWTPEPGPIPRIACAILALGIALSLAAHLLARWRSGPVSRRAEGRAQAWGLRLSGTLLFAAVVVGLLAPESPGPGTWFRLELPDPLRWAGLIAGAAGVIGCAWVFAKLGRNLTDTVLPRRTNSLVTSGPYRWIRHPLYAFGALAWLGLSIAAASWPALLAEAVAVTFLIRRSRREERFLLEVHGDAYRTYRKTTGAFLPRPKL